MAKQPKGKNKLTPETTGETTGETTPETTPETTGETTPETTGETTGETDGVELPDAELPEPSLEAKPASEAQIDKIFAYLLKFRPAPKYRNPARVLGLFVILMQNKLSIEWPEVVKRLAIVNSTYTRTGVTKKMTAQERANFDAVLPAGQQGGGKSAALVREFWRSGQSMTLDSILHMEGSEFQKIGYLVISAARLGLSHNSNAIAEKFGISNISALVSQMVKKLSDLGEGSPFSSRDTVRKYLVTNRTDYGNWREITDADIPDFS